MDFARFNRAKNQLKIKGFRNGAGGAWNSDTHLVIRFPDPRILHVISRSLFLALVILTLPCIVSILGRESSSEFLSVSDLVDSGQLDLLFRDFGYEGITINGRKAVILSSGTDGLTQVRVMDNDERKLDIVLDSDFDQSGLFSDDSFDFVFAWGNVDSDFMDRILKTGGILAFPFTNSGPSNHFQKKPNYRPVFLSRYSSIIVAMEKTAMPDHMVYSSASRRLLTQFSSHTTKAAMRGLEEDILHELPTKAVAKPSNLMRKIKYITDLVDGSLKRLRQTVSNFVTVGLPEENGDMIQYFDQNYPRKGQAEESKSSITVRNAAVDWLKAGFVEKLMEMRAM